MRPSAPITPNTQDQPNEAVIQPISGAKMTVAKYCAELKIAEAVARSCLGNQAATTRLLPGNDGLSAMPSRKRRPNSTAMAVAAAKKPTKPWAMVNSDQTSRLSAYTLL